MIVDSISNFGLYVALHPRFSAVEDFLRKTDINTLPLGRYSIDGDSIFICVVEEDLRSVESVPLEAHNRYIDIQIVLDAEESFGWSRRDVCYDPNSLFDTQRDIIFFLQPPQKLLHLKAEEMIIFLPSDAHAPLIGEGRVKKAIIKVEV